MDLITDIALLVQGSGKSDLEQAVGGFLLKDVHQVFCQRDCLSSAHHLDMVETLIDDVESYIHINSHVSLRADPHFIGKQLGFNLMICSLELSLSVVVIVLLLSVVVSLVVLVASFLVGSSLMVMECTSVV